jgi:hypothetical protein
MPHRLLLGVLAAVQLGACTARPAEAPAPPEAPSLLIADEDFGRDPRPVSGPEAALDLDVAVRAFAEAYAGVDGPPLPPAGRIAATRARLAAGARWDPEALVAELAALFRRPDGHLAFGWDGRAPLRLAAWEPPAREEGARGERGDEEGELPAVYLVPGAVPRLVVRTFDTAAAAELSRLPAIARRLRELPAFVVDLRGNGGGNFGYAESFVLELTSATLRRLDEREVVSVAAAEGRANSARRRLALGEVPPAAAPVFLAHVDALEDAAAALRERGAGRVERSTVGEVVRGRAPGPLRARAVLLVDGGCASACEMTVALARQIPGVVVAGEPTRGSMAAGEIALFRLPRSGVMISLGTRAFRDPLGGFAEMRGFLPDVPLAAGEAGAAGEAVRTPLRRAARRADAAGTEHDPAGGSRVVSPAPTRVSSRR